MLSYADKFKVAKENYDKEKMIKRKGSIKRKKKEKLINDIKFCYNQPFEMRQYFLDSTLSKKIIEEEKLVSEILDDFLEQVKTGNNSYAKIFYLSKKYELNNNVFSQALESKLKKELNTYDYDIKTYADHEEHLTVEVRIKEEKKIGFNKKKYNDFDDMPLLLSNMQKNFKYLKVKDFDSEIRETIVDCIYRLFIADFSYDFFEDISLKEKLMKSGFVCCNIFTNFDSVVLKLFEKKLNEESEVKYNIEECKVFKFPAFIISSL